MKMTCRRIAMALLLLCLAATALGEVTVSAVAQVTTEKGTLNLRQQPDAKGKIVERIPNHSLVQVVSQGDDFCEIQYGDADGYVDSDFLTMTAYSQDALQYRVLFRGNQGADVLALKQRLLDLGYYHMGGTITNTYNDICSDRVKMFERVNSIKEDGIATPAVQALLFSDAAQVNTESLPPPQSNGFVVAASSGASTSTDDIDWNQWMLDHPGVCPCCMGKGCGCCDWTGKI